MKTSYIRWQSLFLFCLGLFTASSFAMKWIEPELLYKNNEISIFRLEFFYSKEKVVEIFSGIDSHVKTILGYHLSYDYVFMAGCFPGIACLCMMAREKTGSKSLKTVLFILACLQLPAWGFDIIENYHLLKWLKTPVIGDEFSFYHTVVYSKWIIALSGALLAFSVFIFAAFKKMTRKALV